MYLDQPHGFRVPVLSGTVHADNVSTLTFPSCVALTLVSCEIVWVNHIIRDSLQGSLV